MDREIRDKGGGEEILRVRDARSLSSVTKMQLLNRDADEIEAVDHPACDEAFENELPELSPELMTPIFHQTLLTVKVLIPYYVERGEMFDKMMRLVSIMEFLNQAEIVSYQVFQCINPILKRFAAIKLCREEERKSTNDSVVSPNISLKIDQLEIMSFSPGYNMTIKQEEMDCDSDDIILTDTNDSAPIEEETITIACDGRSVELTRENCEKFDEIKRVLQYLINNALSQQESTSQDTEQIEEFINTNAPFDSKLVTIMIEGHHLYIYPQTRLRYFEVKRHLDDLISEVVTYEETRGRALQDHLETMFIEYIHYSKHVEVLYEDFLSTNHRMAASKPLTVHRDMNLLVTVPPPTLACATVHFSHLDHLICPPLISGSL